MPQLLSSKNLLLSTRPLTVGVISQPETLTEVLSQSPEQRAAACDLFELRLHLLKLDTADLRTAIPKLDLPVLLTARHPAEGGQGTGGSAAGIALLEPLLDLASLIDIELRSAGDMRVLMQKARGLSVGAAGGFHDFQATPGDEVLKGAIRGRADLWLRRGEAGGPTSNGPEDLIRADEAAHRSPPPAARAHGHGATGAACPG